MNRDVTEAIRSGKYRLVPEAKSERMQLLIRPTTKQALVAIAEDTELSLNELVNRILEDFIYKNNN